MNDIQQILAGINPFKEIPAVWFELFKTQFFLQCVLDSQGPYDQSAIMDKACDFAMGEVKKRFPNLDCTMKKGGQQEGIETPKEETPETPKE